MKNEAKANSKLIIIILQLQIPNHDIRTNNSFIGVSDVFDQNNMIAK
jgi:hypothetical protein